MREIFFIIPAYNEGPRISQVLRSVPKTLTANSETFSIKTIVVDDESKDDTAIKAEKSGAVVVSHVVNGGAGAATRTGMRYVEHYVRHSGKEVAYAVSIDADGQHAVSDVKRLIEHAIKTKSDMVVGNRLHAGNGGDMPFYRTFGNQGLSLLSRLLFGITTKDTQSGLRVFKSTALPVLSGYTIDRYGFATAMLWCAFRSGLKVTEAPITVKYSKETLAKGQNNWGVVDLVKDLIWIRLTE